MRACWDLGPSLCTSLGTGVGLLGGESKYPANELGEPCRNNVFSLENSLSEEVSLWGSEKRNSNKANIYWVLRLCQTLY